MAIGTSDTAAAHGNHRVSIEIGVPPRFAYALWSRFEWFPRFFRHIQEVRVDPQNSRRQHWKGTVQGLPQAWDAEITTLVPAQVIAWRSVSGFENSGSLTFEQTTAADVQGANQTVLTVQIGYDPPLGVLGDVAEILWVKQRFDNDLEEDLTRFKALAEDLYARVIEHTQSGIDPAVAERSMILEAFGAAPAQETGEKDITVDYATAHIPQPNVITIQELKNRLDWGEVAFTLLDVRPLEAYKAGHIRGANAAPLEVLEERAYGLAGRVAEGQDRQLIVYSDRDGLSAQAAERLRQAGYLWVIDYVDGFSAWQEAHLPIETQSTGQIAAKGLPERSDYLDRVITAPMAQDNPVIGPEAATRLDGPQGLAALEERKNP